MPQPRQPFLHDLVCVLAAPTQVWSAPDGEIGSDGGAVGAQGVLHADVRVLSVASLRAAGSPLEHLATVPEGAATRFVAVSRQAAGTARAGDELVRFDRVREVTPGRLSERIEITSLTAHEVSFELTLRLGYDLAAVEQLKIGSTVEARRFARSTPSSHSTPFTWGDDDVVATLTADRATIAVTDDGLTAELTWPLSLAPRSRTALTWSIAITDRSGAVIPPSGTGLPISAALDRLAPGAGRDRRLRPWLGRSLLDLNSLRMATPDRPEDVFFAAGAPWYLTLFGRDSLWTARMVLPIDRAPAVGTLRTLARLAGTRVDPDSAQQPGKIMHELRRGQFTFAETSLPPLYYGTIDATPLWICLLHDLWRTGAADDVVRELLDPLGAALDWLLLYGDADGDGFCEYIDTSGHGLANQGWKDSTDSVRFSDGTIAEGPVALCEVQGYAYEAARAGADLLEVFGRPGAERYREWSDALALRFRDQFWCGGGEDRYPALALDGSKRRVDSLTSNIGHLLGTGLLDADEEVLVARRVAGDALDSGLGLRTMASTDGGYHPLSYHCGSVWPHDTAIVIAGLQRAGLRTYADGLVEGLLDAAALFGGRLPELWSGEGRPVPYAPSCRPQAWSAAAAVVVAQFLATR